MTAKPGLGFKIWTAALSVFAAAVLYPNIVHQHGIGKSLLITGLAVGAIWLMYLVFGRVIDGAVAKELKKRRAGNQNGTEGGRSTGRP
jgi:hypothetical protein